MEVWLDLGASRGQTVGSIPGLAERLVEVLPGLRRGNLQPDLSLAHVFLYITLELEQQAGAPQPTPSYLRVEPASEPGVYVLIFRYAEEYLSRECCNQALAILLAAIRHQPFDIAQAIEKLRAEAARRLPAPATVAITDAAHARDIPVLQLDDKGLLQLGQGIKQRRIRSGQTDRTGAIAHSVAEDKGLVHRLLQAVGVPTPLSYEVSDTEDAWKTAEYVGLPVTVKPGFATEGRGVTANLSTRVEVAAAYQTAIAESSTVMVERHVAGRRYQLLVVAGRMISAARFDASGVKDVTSRVHPEVAARAVVAASAVGLDIAGIDVIAPNVSAPLEREKGYIVDIHGGPKLEPHVTTAESRVRVGQAIVALLFPPAEEARIPVAAVTGTNGKTTVTRFLAHLLKGTDLTVGMSCTDGIYLGDRRINKGDCSGPASARSLLINPYVQLAVCETARGGILRAGLAFDQCKVAVVTNIAGGDHLGIHEIHTPQDLSRVKRTIVQVVTEDGTAVLNATDPLVVSMAHNCRGKVMFFAIDGTHPVIVAHRASNGQAIFVRDGKIICATGRREQILIEVARVPLTFGGRIAFEVENTLASIGAALALGVEPAIIEERASNFAADLETIPTRFNVFETRGATVIVDFGHNPDALRAVVAALDSFPQKRRVAVYSSAGDRRDEDIISMGEMLGNAFDRVTLYEDTDRYKRAPGETIALLRKGLAKGDRVKEIAEIEGGLNAFKQAWESVQPGELLLAQAHTADPTVEYLRQLKV